MNDLSYLKTVSPYALSSLTLAEQFVKFVFDDISDIKRSFVDIAFRLYEADNLRYYSELGFDSIFDLSESLFGLKRSSTYSLISICKRFCGGRMRLLPQYESYSYSQLVELLSLSDSVLSVVPSSSTVSEIRDFKKALHSNNGLISGLDFYQNIGVYHSNTDVRRRSSVNSVPLMSSVDLPSSVQMSGKELYDRIVNLLLEFCSCSFDSSSKPIIRLDPCVYDELKFLFFGHR